MAVSPGPDSWFPGTASRAPTNDGEKYEFPDEKIIPIAPRSLFTAHRSLLTAPPIIGVRGIRIKGKDAHILIDKW